MSRALPRPTQNSPIELVQLGDFTKYEVSSQTIHCRMCDAPGEVSVSILQTSTGECGGWVQGKLLYGSVFFCFIYHGCQRGNFRFVAMTPLCSIWNNSVFIPTIGMASDLEYGKSETMNSAFFDVLFGIFARKPKPPTVRTTDTIYGPCSPIRNFYLTRGKSVSPWRHISLIT